MKSFYFAILLLACPESLHAQTDTVKEPNAGYIKYIEHPETKTANLSYDYSNKWDLDGDGKMDAVYFIGNGGVHSYFFLRVVLSTDNKTWDFPFIQLDMPYISSRDLSTTLDTHNILQFMPCDFDNNGTIDLFLNFNNSFSHIPKAWKKKGIKTKCVIMSFSCAILSVRNP